MKKHAIVFLIILLFPVLLHSLPEKKITVVKLSMKPLPFNERRDPVSDSPYNAFDGDIKTSALYSDFTMEFNEPVTMNEIRIINGSAGDKSLFKKNKRLRDIEITLYTTGGKPEKKVRIKKSGTKKSTVPARKPVPLKKSDTDKKQQKTDNKENIKAKDLINILSDKNEDEKTLLLLALHEENIKDKSSQKSENKNSGNEKKEKQPEPGKSNIIKTPVKPDSESLKAEKIIKKTPPKEKNDPRSKTPKKTVLKNKGTTDQKNQQKKTSEKKKPDEKKSVEKPEQVKKENKTDIRDAVKPDDKKSTDTKDKTKKADIPKQLKTKPAIKKTEIQPEKKSVIKTSEKKIQPDKKTPAAPNNKKTDKAIKKPMEIKTGKKTGKEIPAKKMSGIYRPENDKDGRVFVYHSLKDTMSPQVIKLKNTYTVLKIDLRTMDNEYYPGAEEDRVSIADITFYNQGKKIQIGHLDELKKKYFDKYSESLTNSISGQMFLLYDQNEIILKLTFKKNGKIEFSDRYKCRDKNDKDCTSLLFPDRWRIRNGRLYMRYQELWILWKYELDLHDDLLTDIDQVSDSPRYLKLYYKNEKGFTENYLYLLKNDEGLITEK